MVTDPRLAFEKLRFALEEFHAAAVSYRDPDAPEVLRCSEALADAYIMYDDTLFTHFGIEAPFDTFDDEDFEDDDIEEDDDIDEFDDDFDLDEDIVTEDIR